MKTGMDDEALDDEKRNRLYSQSQARKATAPRHRRPPTTEPTTIPAMAPPSSELELLAPITVGEEGDVLVVLSKIITVGVV